MLANIDNNYEFNTESVMSDSDISWLTIWRFGRFMGK